MTPEQYRKAIEKLGMTVTHAAIVLGIGRRQSFRYASGESAIPEPVARLLACYLEHGIETVRPPSGS